MALKKYRWKVAEFEPFGVPKVVYIVMSRNVWGG